MLIVQKETLSFHTNQKCEAGKKIYRQNNNQNDNNCIVLYCVYIYITLTLLFFNFKNDLFLYSEPDIHRTQIKHEIK